MPTAKASRKNTNFLNKIKNDPVAFTLLVYVLIFSIISLVLVFWQIQANYRRPRLTILPKDIIIATLIVGGAQFIAALKYLYKK